MDMPEEVFLRDDSDDEDDIDLEFTSESDTRHQRYVRSDIVAARITAERERADALQRKADHLQMQASLWKQEARTQIATVADSYRACTGNAGEPGNWHGAEPVRKALAQRDARVANEIADWLEGFVSPANTTPQANAGRDIVNQIRKRAEEIAAGGGHE